MRKWVTQTGGEEHTTDRKCNVKALGLVCLRSNKGVFAVAGAVNEPRKEQQEIRSERRQKSCSVSDMGGNMREKSLPSPPLPDRTIQVYESVTQSCLTLCHTSGPQPARFLCPRNSPGKNIGVVSSFLLLGIFLTQGLNPGLLPCWQIL